MTHSIVRGETVSVPRGTVYQPLSRASNDAAATVGRANTAPTALQATNTAAASLVTDTQVVVDGIALVGWTAGGTETASIRTLGFVGGGAEADGTTILGFS